VILKHLQKLALRTRLVAPPAKPDLIAATKTGERVPRLMERVRRMESATDGASLEKLGGPS